MIEIEVRVTCDECGATGKLLVTDDELVPTYKDVAGNQVYKLEATVCGQEQWNNRMVPWYHFIPVDEDDYVDICHKCAPKFHLNGQSNGDTPVGFKCHKCGHTLYKHSDATPLGWRSSDDGWECTLCQDTGA